TNASGVRTCVESAAIYFGLNRQRQPTGSGQTWRLAATPQGFRDSTASLPRENQFDSSNHQHCREAKRNYAHSKSSASQMRADDAADNCCCCQDQTERRNGADFCEVADQAGNRVHPNKQCRDGSGLSNMRPAKKKQDRRQKNSAARAG